VSRDPRQQKPPLFRVFDRDPDRHRPVDGDYVQSRPVRLHRPGPWRTTLVVALALLAAWVGLAAVLAVSVAAGLAAKLVVGAVVMVPVLLVYWLTARVLSVGVYATDVWARQNRVVTAVEADWSDVVDVRRVAGRVRLLGLGPRVAGEQVFLVLRDGSDIATSITTHGADFLLRPEAYDQAALAVEHWWTGTQGRTTP
jgi:hypothetical protein